MIKVFTTNKNGKIELTKDELKSLLDEAYWDGYRTNSGTFTYYSPYAWSSTTANNATLSSTLGYSTASTPNSSTISSTIDYNTTSAPNSACEAH